MTHFPQTQSQRRAPRIQLGGSVPALILMEDGQRTKGNLQTVSVTGGLLHLTKSLRQGDFVEVAFNMQTGAVRGMAEMLSPLPKAIGKITSDTRQAFRFIALGDDDHRALRMAVDAASDLSFLKIRQRPSFLSK